jgi:hypothetical protein
MMTPLPAKRQPVSSVNLICNCKWESWVGSRLGLYFWLCRHRDLHYRRSWSYENHAGLVGDLILRMSKLSDTTIHNYCTRSNKHSQCHAFKPCLGVVYIYTCTNVIEPQSVQEIHILTRFTKRSVSLDIGVFENRGHCPPWDLNLVKYARQRNQHRTPCTKFPT